MLFGKKLVCWCGKKDCGQSTAHTTNFQGAYKQSPTIFAYLTIIPTWSLHNSNEIPPDIAPTSINSETYQTVSSMTSTGSGSGTANDVLCIKHSVVISGSNRFKTQSTNPYI